MFSLIRSCKVERLSRNWQDIHHGQGGKLFRLQMKENWMWYSKIWLDRKLKICLSPHPPPPHYSYPLLLVLIDRLFNKMIPISFLDVSQYHTVLTARPRLSLFNLARSRKGHLFQSPSSNSCPPGALGKSPVGCKEGDNFFFVVCL